VAALRSVGAEDMPEDRYAAAHRFVERHADERGVPKPELKIARMGTPNAFAVGRKGAVVVVSEELIQLLDTDELEGVLAHEIAHVANRDVVTIQLGQGIASIVAIVAQYVVLLTGDNDLADFFLAIVVGNVVQFIVMIFVLAVSRYREYVADADAKDAVESGDVKRRGVAIHGRICVSSWGRVRPRSSTDRLAARQYRLDSSQHNVAEPSEAEQDCPPDPPAPPGRHRDRFGQFRRDEQADQRQDEEHLEREGVEEDEREDAREHRARLRVDEPQPTAGYRRSTGEVIHVGGGRSSRHGLHPALTRSERKPTQLAVGGCPPEMVSEDVRESDASRLSK
jgi:hypothetical protein